MSIDKRVSALIVAMSFFGASSAQAADCQVSKKFELKKAQRLLGVLKDPLGYPLYGFRLDLLKNGKIVLTQITNNSGGYDFGEVSPGKYRLRVSQGGRATGFCAPTVKCAESGCAIGSTLKLGPQTTVVM